MSDNEKPPTNENREKPDAYAAFREPAFRWFMLGSLLVRIGTGAQSMAIGWDLYVRTESAMALAMVGLVQAIPMLVLTLPAGYLADVLDRRKLMLAGMTGTTLTSLGLAAFSYFQGSIVMMYALLFLDSVALRATAPARTALIPLLVPESKLENAMTWRTSTGQIASVAGPGLGGLLMTWSVPATYLVCAMTTALFMLMLALITIPEATRSAPGRMFAQVMEGIRFVWHRPVVLGAISLDLFAVLLGGAVMLLPIYAKDVIDLAGTGLSEEQALGVLRAAPAVGAMLMALWVAHLPPIQRAGRVMLLAVVNFGLATVVFGISQNLWLSLAMLLLTGAFDNISVVIRHTLVMLQTPDEMRGRVSAVNAVFIGSSNQIGGFRAGAVAAAIGPVLSVVAGGIGTLAVVGTWAGLFPKLRQYGTLSGREPQTSDESAESAEAAATETVGETK